ncbi:zinc finger, CCHC-type containing protein [Tanacetum coccineum]
MDSIMGNNTWMLADLLPGCKPMGCNKIFKKKIKVDGTVEKFKARLVIQGFRQKSRIDYFDTYAPAPDKWHQKFDEVVLSNGYFLNQADKCVDMTKEFLSSRFSMKDTGEANVILSIRIKHESNGILISQSHYIEKVLKKFNYFDYTPVSTSMDTSDKLVPNNVGKLTLAAVGKEVDDASKMNGTIGYSIREIVTSYSVRNHQGYDCCFPMMSAWNLHKAWPEAEFKVDDGEWELRAESVSLKEHADAQSKELLQRKQQVEELQEKERVAIENVEGLMMHIATAEEEITRLEKSAAITRSFKQANGRLPSLQISTIRQELEEAKQAVIESEKKLKFKEETVAAAMAARDAAET